METTRILKIAAFLLIVTVAVTLPSVTQAGSFAVHFNNGHTGFSFGSGGWSVYGSSWFDPHWSLSYDSALAGYGEWIWVDGLGQVWRPWVAAGWAPFSHGRWASTSLGWTWVSYEPWGYFPHHYGEWALTVHGWVWRQGYVYSPANVVWVNSSFHVGWYPRAPHGWGHYNSGHSRAYGRGYDRGYWDGCTDAMHATYVPWNKFGTDDLSRHRVSARSVAQRSAGSRIQKIDHSPSRSEIRRRGGVVAPASVLERRTVNVGGRDVVVARPKDAGRSVERNARETVSRVLPSSVSRRYQAGSSLGSNTKRSGAAGSASPTATERSLASRESPDARKRDSVRQENLARSGSDHRFRPPVSAQKSNPRRAPSRAHSQPATAPQPEVSTKGSTGSTRSTRVSSRQPKVNGTMNEDSSGERSSSRRASNEMHNSRNEKATVDAKRRTERKTVSTPSARSRRR